MMPSLASALFANLGLASLARAHMMLAYPAPFNGSNNPHRTTPPDVYLQYPYDCCGENDRWSYPCRGYEKLLDTPDGAPTATWKAGTIAYWNMTGIGNHYGGSCQVGFSVDKGKTFRVATSYEGNCPHRNQPSSGTQGQNFEFRVPSDLDIGVQLFAWIWYNREQELNMNCAAVNITPAEPQTYSAKMPRAVSYGSRPLMFVADDGNDCQTPHATAELKYPFPGPDVVSGDGVYPLQYPEGSCSPDKMLAKQSYAGAVRSD
ncbi:uncharacterized protein MYCFIDRAFT_195305 [Pseudocercospora fijiensis CIRAD86]|uniref:Lytic polysaccharide monooxygenase n=1 Tax=Pseudocercospora fijiensis (strain CIRAD86) TaxID=383855 RepID=M3B475_PSEFD|nr:uncharacterized protein MYCFIDRAFT_195305 [Pseudocercospora fijiensis CIRAD86]EME84178.1 hypothetical protein MYCFIDRAFT_195305 [Pseudocercospora fijiensis CIRAD86]